MSRLARKLNYKVIGYDLNNFSLFVAKLLSFSKPNISYEQKNLYDINQKFDAISATSLLSVVDNKREALEKLLSLLSENDSSLVIVEPTEKLSLKNVWKLIDSFRSFWFYKGLLVWAWAREGKSIDMRIFDDLVGLELSHTYYLEEIVCITYIQRVFPK